jgi:septum formation topological specificity factor MinE
VEGARHRRHDDVLTVDQRAVAVEDDEVHVGVYRAEAEPILALVVLLPANPRTTKS